MKKSLITKAMSIFLSVGLVSCILPTVSASADHEIHTAGYGSETVQEALAVTSEAYEPSTTTVPAETTVPIMTTAPIDTTTEYVTATIAETQLTEAATGTTAAETEQTFIRTTRTKLPDEDEITCGINSFVDGAYVGFDRSLKNVYMIEIEYPEVMDKYKYEAGLRFDVELDGEQYQIIYPLSILSYNSKEGSYSAVYIANDFSYAAVRYGDTETTVSALDVVDSALCDKFYDALTECDGAVLEITETAPYYSGTTCTADSSGTTHTTAVPDSTTTVGSTTMSFYAEYPIIMINRNYTLEGEYVIPADAEPNTEINVEVSKEGVLEVVSAETVKEAGIYKYTAELHGIGEGATEVVVSVYDHKFYFLVTVENENGQGIYDLNRDGKVDLADATYVLDIYTMKAAKLKVTGYTRESLARADVDGDGSVTLSDATAVLTYYAENAANLK